MQTTTTNSAMPWVARCPTCAIPRKDIVSHAREWSMAEGRKHEPEFCDDCGGVTSFRWLVETRGKIKVWQRKTIGSMKGTAP
jgi:hypothetical protein